MATNEVLKTHCYYTMYNKVTGEYKDVVVNYPFSAEKARNKCSSEKALQKQWIVASKGFY